MQLQKHRRELRKPAEDFRVANIFKSNKHDYKIEKVKEDKYSKFNSSRSEYKIYSDVDIFQVHNAITELINKMTMHGLVSAQHQTVQHWTHV